MSILESVNDQVIASKYPLFATALWERWNNFCLKLSVSFDLIFSGWINEILSNPFILISSSIKSTSSFKSGLQLGGKTLIFLPLIFNEHPREIKIFLISKIVIENPITLKNFSISKSMVRLVSFIFPAIENLLA